MGAVIYHPQNFKVMWFKRLDKTFWQFPQGGIDADETPTDALFREIYEEIGICRNNLTITAKCNKWLDYLLPKEFRKYKNNGQRQLWFLLKLNSASIKPNFTVFKEQEFDDWQWIDYKETIKQIIYFKKEVYEEVFKQFSPILEKLSATKINA